MGSEIHEHLKSRQMLLILYLKSRQNPPDFEWSAFQMVRTITAFENQTIWNLINKSGFQMCPDFELSN